MPDILGRAVGRHRRTVYVHRRQTFVPLRVATVKNNPVEIINTEILCI